jgi:hypothetical protein
MRFSMSDDSSTVAESMQKALDSLECPLLQCQLNMYGQSRGRLEYSIRVPATTPALMAAILSPPTSVAMAATSPPPTSVAMAATSPPSTPVAMAAPPPPYDRVLMVDGSVELFTSAGACTFYISSKQAVDVFYGSKLNMDGRNFYEIDVVYHLGLFYHRKTAFVLLWQQRHPVLYEAS